MNREIHNSVIYQRAKLIKNFRIPLRKLSLSVQNKKERGSTRGCRATEGERRKGKKRNEDDPSLIEESSSRVGHSSTRGCFIVASKSL